MLWKRGEGPLIAGGVVGYRISESHNYQIPLASRTHRHLVPRLEMKSGNQTYNSAYFTSPRMESDGYTVKVSGGLSNQECRRLEGDFERLFTYTLTEDGIELSIEGAEGAEFVLPLIAGELQIIRGEERAAEEIFFITGGFIASEHIIAPDESGRITLKIK